MNGITISIFAAILSLTLTITAWAARRTRTATDFYAAGKGLTAAQNVHERAPVMAARITAITVGIVATLLGILAEGVNVAVLVILAICIAASANFRVLAV